jgi:membrane protein
VAAPGFRSGRQRRGSFPKKAGAKRAGSVSGDFIVTAALIGISRAFFGPSKQEVAGGAAVQETAATDAGRGRAADEPKEIPAKGWKDIVWRVYDDVQSDRVLLVAAGVTFYALLALFPATAAMVSLYGLFADATTIGQHLGLISGFLPEGAVHIISEQVQRIAEKGQGTLGFAFLGTLVLSLWGANAGTKAIFDALNIIYKEREKRGFLKLTLSSLAFTLGGILLMVVALAGVVAVPLGLRLLEIPAQSTAGLLTLLRWPLLYVVILFALASLYRYGPSRTKPQWRWVTWGSAIAGGTWLLGSLLLSWYVANFGSYNATYGSLGAIIGFMVWMWLSTTIVLVGAEINAEMEHQTAKDTTEGRRKPLGERGATVADHIGESRG